MSTVLQNGRVFSGSIQMNIAGAAQLTQDEYWAGGRGRRPGGGHRSHAHGHVYVAEGRVTLRAGSVSASLIARGR